MARCSSTVRYRRQGHAWRRDQQRRASRSAAIYWELNTTGSAVADQRHDGEPAAALRAGKGRRHAHHRRFLFPQRRLRFSSPAITSLSLNASISILARRSRSSRRAASTLMASPPSPSGRRLTWSRRSNSRHVCRVVNTTGSSHFGVSGNTVEIRADDLRADWLAASGSLSSGSSTAHPSSRCRAAIRSVWISSGSSRSISTDTSAVSATGVSREHSTSGSISASPPRASTRRSRSAAATRSTSTSRRASMAQSWVGWPALASQASSISVVAATAWSDSAAA